MGVKSTARTLISAGVTLIATGIVISCSPDTTAPTLQARPSATSIQATTTAGSTPTHVALRPFTDQACLKCHVDQKSLTTLAVVKQESEALSSGPG